MRCSNLGLLTLVSLAFSFASCGESSKRPAPVTADAGEGGDAAGGSEGRSEGGSPDAPDPVRCGPTLCKPIMLPGGDAVAPCCADADRAICGADLSLLMPSMGCQPLTQPGAIDQSCPASPGGELNGLPLPVLPGCCREEAGECGFMLGDLGGLLPFPPGCIDAGPFLNGEAPRACGEGGSGGAEGGSGGAGGGGGGGSDVGGAAGDGQGAAAGMGGAAGASENGGVAGADAAAGSPADGGAKAAP